MSKAEALSIARRLVQEAVDVANRADIDPADVVEPYCDEAGNQNAKDRGSKSLTWCCVPVTIDNDTLDLFAMPKPDDDPQQMPAFVVTQSTANLVQQDFERYKPSLERMAEEWRKAKRPVSSAKNRSQGRIMTEDLEPKLLKASNFSPG